MEDRQKELVAAILTQTAYDIYFGGTDMRSGEAQKNAAPVVGAAAKTINKTLLPRVIQTFEQAMKLLESND